VNAAELLWLLARDAFWSGLAALGFAVLFNVPRGLLPGCVLAGAAGHATRTLLMSAGLSIELSTLFAATLVGVAAQWLSRRTDSPTAIFGVAGAIPMVPGVYAYQTMIGLLGVASATPETGIALLAEAGTYAVKTALILSAIAMGIAAPTLLFQRPRPVN